MVNAKQKLRLEYEAAKSNSKRAFYAGRFEAALQWKREMDRLLALLRS